MVRLVAADGRREEAEPALSLALASVAVAAVSLPAAAAWAAAAAGLASALDSVLGSAAFVSGAVAGVAGFDGAAADALASSGFGVGCLLGPAPFSCADMMAGSTGAPLTVAWPVGARRAGGVYLFSRLPRDCWASCRRTPLYL